MSTKRRHFSEIISLIKEIKGLDSDYAVATALGIKNRRTFSAQKLRDSLPIDEIIRFCATEKINLHWLLIGQGSRYLGVTLSSESKKEQINDKFGVESSKGSESPKSDQLHASGHTFPRFSHTSIEQFIKIPVFHLAGAGGGAHLEENDPIEEIQIPKEWEKEGTVAVKIIGNSMEPVILDGARVGVDTRNRKPVSGELYALWIPHEGAVVKWLFVEPDGVRIKSENPRFKDITVDFERVSHDNFIIGRVIWIMQKV